MKDLPEGSASFAYTAENNAHVKVEQLNALLVPENVTYGSSGLCSLRLVTTSLDDAKLARIRFRAARELKYLTLVDQRFNDNGLKRALFPLLHRLIYLDIRHNYFLSDEFILAINEAAKDMQLKLMTDSTENVFAQATSKDLSNKQLSDLDIVSLCRHLRTCTNGGGVGLDVDLSSNRIGDRGAEVLAQTLEESPDCLKSLNIQNNFIGNRGWKALYCAILKSSIQQVCVLQNPITLSNLHRGKLGEIFPQCRIELDQAIFQSGRWMLPSRPTVTKRRGSSSIRKLHSAAYEIACKQRAEEIQQIYSTPKDSSSVPTRADLTKNKGKSQQKSRKTVKARIGKKGKSATHHFKKRKRKKGSPRQPASTAVALNTNHHAEPKMSSNNNNLEESASATPREANKGNTVLSERGTGKRQVRHPGKGQRGREILEKPEFTDSFKQLQSAIKIQGLYRCMRARRKVAIATYISGLKSDKKAQECAVTIQRSARGKIARFTLRVLHLKAVLIQRVFRRYYARTRLLNAARLATKNALVAKDFIDQIKSIHVRGCGTKACQGRYDIAGSQEDHTRRYMQAHGHGEEESEYIYSVERTTMRDKDKDQEVYCWVLIQHKGANSTILYINKAEGLSLKPPTHSWDIVAGQSPGPSLEWRRESIDASHNRLHASKPGFVISEAGVHCIQGKFLQAGRSDGVAAYRLLKGKSQSQAAGETWLRRIKYMSSDKKLWIICSNVNDQVKVFYVNSEDGHEDTPPSSESAGTWKLGQHGKNPIPLIVRQQPAAKVSSDGNKPAKTVQEKLRTRRETLRVERAAAEAKFGKHEELSSEDSVVKATRCIQRNYRSHMLLNLSKNPRMIKEVRSVHQIKVERCGELRAQGKYTLSGVSGHFSNSMRYIKEVSEDEMYIIERMENNTWSLVQLLNGKVSLLYANSENGYSLRPPLQRWQSVNMLDKPSPKIEWMKEEPTAHYDIFHTKSNSKEPAFLVLDSGTSKIHGRYEEAGESDGVPMYRLTRNIKVQLRRIRYNNVSLWVICRPTPELNLVYFCNTAHGHSETPPLEDWLVAQHGDEPEPIILLAPEE